MLTPSVLNIFQAALKRIPLCFVVVLICGGAVVHALTLSTIRDQIRRNVRDTASASARQRYSDAILLEFINEAQREVVNLTWLTEATTTYGLTTGTTFYDLPSDFLAVKLVEYEDTNSATIELKEKTYKRTFQDNPDWDNSITDPLEYFILQDDDTSLQVGYVGIPSASSTGTVTIRYLNLPSDLAADGDLPFDGKLHLIPYHYSIVYHATARLKLIESKVEEANAYVQLFNISVGLAQDRLGQSPNLFPKLRGFTTNAR